MKSVALYERNKMILKELTGEKTYNLAINSLIDDVEAYMPFIDGDYGKRSPVRIDDETIERIKSFSLTEGESVENILVRMLLVLNSIKE